MCEGRLAVVGLFFFFKQKTAYEMRRSIVGSEMCIRDRRYYECEECTGCPLKSQCTKAEGNREIHVSLRLLAYRKRAREKLTSEEGKRLRARRSVEVESVFGQLKQNMGFRRFRLRGLEKVKTEFGLVSIAHNMKKLAAQ